MYVYQSSVRLPLANYTRGTHSTPSLQGYETLTTVPFPVRFLSTMPSSPISKSTLTLSQATRPQTTAKHLTHPTTDSFAQASLRANVSVAPFTTGLDNLSNFWATVLARSQDRHSRRSA